MERCSVSNYALPEIEKLWPLWSQRKTKRWLYKAKRMKTLLVFCDWKTSSLVQKQTFWLHSCKESCQQKKDLDHSNKQTKILLIWAHWINTSWNSGTLLKSRCSIARNKLCCLGVAEIVLRSLGEYFFQSLSLTYVVSVHFTYSIR